MHAIYVWFISIVVFLLTRGFLDCAVLQYTQIASLPEAKASERSLLHEWIESSAFRFVGRDLGGYEQPSVYAEFHQKDLAILADRHGEDDLFTKFIRGPLLTGFHWIWRYKKVCLPSLDLHYVRKSHLAESCKEPIPVDLGSRPLGDNKSHIHHYSDSRVEVITNLLVTVLSSVAPLVSIVALSFVANARARLGLVCGFTLLFSICIAVATKARRVETFAATAA